MNDRCNLAHELGIQRAVEVNFGGDEVRVPFGISRGRVLKEGKGSASPRAQHVADNRKELLG